MIENILTSDIQSEINFGIDDCCYNSNKLKNKTSIKPTHEIFNFHKLKELLNK